MLQTHLLFLPSGWHIFMWDPFWLMVSNPIFLSKEISSLPERTGSLGIHADGYGYLIYFWQSFFIFPVIFKIELYCLTDVAYCLFQRIPLWCTSGKRWHPNRIPAIFFLKQRNIIPDLLFHSGFIVSHGYVCSPFIDISLISALLQCPLRSPKKLYTKFFFYLLWRISFFRLPGRCDRLNVRRGYKRFFVFIKASYQIFIKW